MLGRTQERLTFNEVIQGICFMATENVNHANNIIETETEGVPSSGKYNFSLSCSMQFPLATRLPTTNHGRVHVNGMWKLYGGIIVIWAKLFCWSPWLL
jgi:hypothetical protein